MSDNENTPRKHRTVYWLGASILFGILALIGQYLYWKYKEGLSTKEITTAVKPKDNRLYLAVHDYIQWTDSLRNRTMDYDHELTRTGLRKISAVLAVSTDSLGTDRAPQVQNDIAGIRAMADSITYYWRSGRHADMIKKAFSMTIDASTLLGIGKSPAAKTALSGLQTKTEAISKETLTLHQRDAVKDAFEQTAVLFAKAVAQ